MAQLNNRDPFVESMEYGIRILRDSSPDHEALRSYFDRNYVLFLARMEEMRKAPEISTKEEKEICFMLESLLAAKQLLAEGV